MAPKKKYKGPKAASSSPNVVLVVFLIIFVLTSIGLGVSTYYGFEGQKKLQEAAKAAEAKLDAAKKQTRLQEYFRQEAMKQIGLDLLPADGAYSEEANWKSDRKQFLDGSMNFKGMEKYTPHIKNLIATGEDAKYLGTELDPAKNSIGYKKTWKQLVDELRQQIAALENARQKANSLAKSFQTNFSNLATDFDPVYDKLRKDNNSVIQSGLSSIQTTMKEMQDEWVKVQQVEDLRTRDQLAFAEAKRGLLEKIRKLGEKVIALEDELGDPASKVGGGIGGGKGKGGSGQPYALMLDVSKGRPLWDLPKGKILRVNNKTRQVLLNVGTEDGVKNRLTFSVFAAGQDGQAQGFLKGTVEIFNAKLNTSEGKITAVYTEDGVPIPLGGSQTLASKRMSEYPIGKDDLLYNMFWNSRVALAGKFNITGKKSYSAAQDAENMKQFRQFLESQNIQVDAQVDPRDGKIVGKIVPSTRFLIVGGLGHLEQQLLDENPKDKAAAETLLKGIKKMRSKAIDRGMFIVSATNFTGLIGYQPPRSEESVEVPTFVPSPLFVGRPRNGGGVGSFDLGGANQK